MIKRLAVIIAGEYRMWPVASRYLFDYFKDRAEQTDFFFVTWTHNAGTLITESDVSRYFVDQPATGIFLCNPIAEKHTYYKQAYLSKIGNILKRQQELRHNFVYDQVVETRPDLYIRRAHDWLPCQDFEYVVAPIKTEKLEGNIHGMLFMMDIYYRTTSLTNDIISNRYWNIKSTFNNNANITSGVPFVGHHWYLPDYLMQHRLISQSDRVDYGFNTIIRSYFPDIDLHTLSPNEILDFHAQATAAGVNDAFRRDAFI
jgi:hypothetical protein